MFKKIKNKILKTYTKNGKFIPNSYYRIRSIKPIKAKKLKANKNVLRDSAIAVAILVLVYLESFLKSITLFHIPTAIIALLIPGYLLLRGVRVENEKRLPYMLKLALMSCLGIAWTMLIGLAIDVILPAFGNKHPLSSSILPLLFALATGALIPWALRYKIAPKKNKTFKKINKETAFLYSLLALTVLFSFCGTRLLNNGYTNILTIIAFIVGIFSVAFTIAKQKKLPNSTYPLVLFAISLVCVWSYSLRSNYVFGWDIQQEYQVFQTTLKSGNWILGAKHGSYDAMLSLTILPVALTKIAGVAGLTFFKVISPLFFSLVPVILYYTYRIFTKRWVSFVASLLIISQFAYMQQFSALVRQQIAFLFFACILYLLVQNRLTNKSKSTLLIWFTFALVVAHYSTTYLAIIFFGGTYVLSKLIQVLIRRFKNKNVADNNKYIQGWMIIVLIASAVLWYGPATHSSGLLQKLTQKHVVSIIYNDLKDTFKSPSYNPKTSQEFLNTTGNRFKLNHKDLKYYPGASNSTIKPLTPQAIEPHVHFLKTFMDGIDYILNVGWWILGGFGILVIIYSSYKRIGYRKLELGTLGVIGIIAFVAIKTIPYLQKIYNPTRLNEQVLMFVALPALLMLIWLFRSLSRKIARTTIVTLALISFAFAAGIIPQFIGGSPTANLNNFGADYNNFYVKQTELSSAQWLRNNYISKNSLVYVDSYASLRLTSSNKTITYRSYNVTPENISINSFVYGDQANVKDGITTTVINNNGFSYQFPATFLQQNKNLVYSNGSSEVYR